MMHLWCHFVQFQPLSNALFLKKDLPLCTTKTPILTVKVRQVTNIYNCVFKNHAQLEKHKLRNGIANEIKQETNVKPIL